MTTQQAATALNLEVSVVRRQAGRIPWFGTKRGRDWWFTKSQVERYRNTRQR